MLTSTVLLLNRYLWLMYCGLGVGPVHNTHKVVNCQAVGKQHLMHLMLATFPLSDNQCTVCYGPIPTLAKNIHLNTIL